MDLWIDRYKPKKLEEFIGNKKIAEHLKAWLSDFKSGGVILCGGTGIGKSLIVETLALENSLLLLQLNANDIDTEAVQEIIRGSQSKSIFHKGKIILIDDLDGISARGGLGAEIIELVKTSKYPVFLIASDPYSPKLKTLKGYCTLLKFDKIPSPSISKRLGDICMREGIEADKDALGALAKFCQGDLRSAITDLQIACLGKEKLSLKDLEVLGYREREQSVFNTLQPIFHSRNINAGRSAIQASDKDSDEIFWWVENNLLQEFKTPEEIAEAYDLLSHSDILRGRTMKQQNWRFKAIASDLISGISVLKKSHTGFVMYRPQQRFIQLAKAKAMRRELSELSEQLGNLHCSRRKIAQEYLPFLKFFERSSAKKEKAEDKAVGKPLKEIKKASKQEIKKEAGKNPGKEKQEKGTTLPEKILPEKKEEVKQEIKQTALKPKSLFSFG